LDQGRKARGKMSRISRKWKNAIAVNKHLVSRAALLSSYYIQRPKERRGNRNTEETEVEGKKGKKK
jgi:hypothetical protein